MKINLLILLIAIYCLSCSSSRLVNGEVFVVTKGAGNVKLGLIRLDVVSKTVLNEHLATKKEELSEKFDLAKEQFDTCEAKFSKFSGIDDVNSLASQGLDQCRQLQDLAVLSAATAALRDIGPVLTQGQTNSDGKFSMTVPTNEPVVILATGSRAVAGSEEMYLWIKPVSMDAASDTLISNDSLITPLNFTQLLAGF